MESLFRFLLVRQPEEVDEKRAAVPLKMTTTLQRSISDALSSDSPRQAVKEVVETFINAQERYIDHPHKLHYHSGFSKLWKRIKDGGIDSLDDLKSAINSIFHQSAQIVAASPEFAEDQAKCADSIIAIKLTPIEHGKPISELVRMFRVMALIKRAADDDILLNEEGTILRSLRAGVVFPDSFALSSFIETRSSGKSARLDKIEKVRLFKEAKDKVKSVNKAIHELMNLKTTDIKLVSRESESPEQPITGGTFISAMSATEGDGSFLSRMLGFFGISEKKNVTSSRTPLVVKPSESKMMISSEALERLDNTTKSVLAEAGVDASTLSYQGVIDSLEVVLADAGKKVSELGPVLIGKFVSAGDGSLVYKDAAEYYEFLGPIDEGIGSLGPWPMLPLPFSTIKPIGVGELLLVKQQLIRYQGGDVAHIENILKSENKLREHRRTKRTEQFYLTETEIATEEEMDLESTERYELQREAEETIREEHKLETGLNITASYGSVLEVEASLDYTYDNVKETSKKVASEYSKEVVNKAVSKLSEKIHEKKTLQIIEEYEEKNSHGFDNKDGADHIIGVYQWVDKVYEARVYNYGLREMYDLMVPEPGAFLAEALKQNLAEDQGLKAPPYFFIEPQDLDQSNYQYYVWLYNVSDVEPPPKHFITISKAIHSSGRSEEGTNVASAGFSTAEDLKIEDGYKAVSANVTVFASDASEHYAPTFITIGRHILQSVRWNNDTATWEYRMNLDCILDEETDSIPIAVVSPDAVMLSVAIEITCEWTVKNFQKWQHDTYDLIMQAYLNKKAAVEEKLAAMAIQKGETIPGRNPAANKKLIKDELKKACISLMTKQHYDDFNAIELGSNDLPQTNLTEAQTQGRFIRFFEQAFEWENMTYVLYPYYWGRKEVWLDKIKYEDADPMFTDFISSGAARVVVPARDSFRSAIRHYLTTGEVWMGGALPDIESSLYLPIAEELKGQLGAPGDEKPVGEPWTVVIPTNLVRLRPDGSLPEWTKNEEEEWVPVESAEP